MSLTRQDSNIIPILSLLGAAVVWGSSFIAMKVAVMAFDPLLVILCRMILASIIFLLAFKRLKGVRYKKGDWRLILIMGVCEPGMYFVFEAFALRQTTASQAGMVASTLPLMMAVAARFFLKEKTNLSTWLGFILAMIGVIWLSGAGTATESAPDPVLGNTLEMIAMGWATGYMIILKHLSSRYPPWFLTAMQAFVGAVFFFPVVFMPFTAWPVEIHLEPLIAVLYLGTIVTIGGYGLYNFGMSRMPAAQASAFINLIPVITVFLGWLYLGETFTPQQFAASGLVLAGVVLSQRSKRDDQVKVKVKGASGGRGE